MMRLCEPSACKSFLKRIGSAATARALWLALGLLVSVGLFSLWSTSALIQTNNARIQLRMLLTELQDTLSTLADAETGQRGYLLVGEDSYLEPYEAAAMVVDQQMDRVEELMNALPGQRSKFDAMRQLVALKFAELQETIQLRESEGIEAAMQVVRTGRGKELMDEIRSLANQIKPDVEQRLAAYDQRTAALSMRAAVGSILGNVLAAILFVWILRREFRERTRVEIRARELALLSETWRVQATAKAEGSNEALEQQPREVTDFVHALQEHTLTESDKEIKALAQQVRELSALVETSRLQSLNQSDKEIEALGKRARDLATSVESSRIKTLNQSDREIEALGKRARDLATSVESSRIKTLNQSDEKIEAMGQQARDLATSVETSRIETLNLSDEKIEALGQQARDLATSVESSRIQTLNQSDEKIEAMGQQARDLATSVESSRIQTLNQSDEKIEAMGQQARDLATSVESSRIKTLNRSDKEIEALGQQARDLAAFVETSRMLTLIQSDKEIAALVQQARDLATSVETSRIQTLNQSNKEIRKLNEELEQRVLKRTAQLEAANKELDAFSYSVSHDLRAPLRAIDGFSRIVLEDFGEPLATEGKAYLQLVRDNTRQMGQLVDDLLAFARLGRQALTKHPVDPDKIVRRCLAEMTKEQEGRHVEIVIGELPSCNADPTLLKQVWTNLLANALKYSRSRETSHIEIGCRTQPRLVTEGHPNSPESPDSEVVYFVKDNGAGFDMKYVHKLFGVFQRLHRTAEYEGTGVGLAIVQRIVQRHGGRIWADAKVDQGATFSFTLE